MEDRHPDEGPGRDPAGPAARGDEEGRALAHDQAALGRRAPAFDRSGPGRAPDQDRPAALVGLAGRARHSERDRVHGLLEAGGELVALGDGALLGPPDGGQDEAVEVEVAGQLLAQGAHDRPLVEAGGQAASDRVHDLQPPPLGFDGGVAPGVAHGQRHLVGHLLQEGQRRLLVGVPLAGLDGERAPDLVALLDRHPDRRREGILGPGVGPHVGGAVVHDRAGVGDQRRAPGHAGRGHVLARAVAQQPHHPLGALLGRDQLGGVDRDPLHKRVVERCHHSALVQGRGKGARDGVQGGEPDRLVAGGLVQVGVGDEHAQAAVDLLQEGDLLGRHAAAPVGLIEDAADDLVAVLDGQPDDGPGRAAGAGPAVGGVGAPGGVGDDRLGLLVPLGGDRLRQRPPADVLEDAEVDVDGVVPALALQHRDVDDLVGEDRVQLGVEDLDDVGFRGAAAEGLDEAVPHRRQRLLVQSLGGLSSDRLSHGHRYTAGNSCLLRRRNRLNRLRRT